MVETMAELSTPAGTIPQWFNHSEYTHKVAQCIAMYGPVSRMTLAQILHLSQGALSKIVSDLIYEGVVEEVDTAGGITPRILPYNYVSKNSDSKRGRPQQALQICADSKSFIGIKILGKEFIAILTNALCEPISEPITTPITDSRPEKLADSICSVIAQLSNGTSNSATATTPPTAIGISIGGHIIHDSVVTSAPFLHWDGEIDLGALVQQRCNIPTAIFNDLDSLLKYESWFGLSTGVQRFAIVTFGAGVGYTLAHNGEVIDDPDRSFGMGGHILVDPDGPTCFAGHKGCSECLTSGSLATQYSHEIGKIVSFDDFVRDVQSESPIALDLVHRFGFRAGVFLSFVAGLAMPKKILIGGESAFLLHYAMDPLRSGAALYRPNQASPVQFEFMDASWTRWALGAASCVITRYIMPSER